MDEEEGFLVVLANEPADLIAHLVYADWLEEHDDPGSECLRAWVELVQTPYDDATYRVLLAQVERFQAALKVVEPDWLELVRRSRDWVNAALAEKLVRLHLRVRHGRKSDRQWLGRPDHVLGVSTWRVAYGRSNPATWRSRFWGDSRESGSVEVHCVNATVTEAIRRRKARADATQPAE